MKRKLLTLITFLACAAGTVQAQVASWDFSTISETDKTNLAVETSNSASGLWTEDTDNGRYNNTTNYSSLQSSATSLTANSTELEYTKGLKFCYNNSKTASAGKIRLNYSKGYLQLNGSKITVTIPSCKANYIIAVEYATASSENEKRGFSISDEEATISSGAASTDYNTVTTLIATVTTEGDVTLKTTGGLNVRSIKVYDNTQAETVTISSEYGVNTFSSSNALDFTDTGVTPYVASEVDRATVTLSDAYKKIPAKTGLIIKGTKGAYIVPVIASTEAETIAEKENVKLVASVEATTVAANPATGCNYIFGISNSDTDGSTIGFYKVTSNATSAAGKAYLWVSSELSDAEGAKYFALDFDGDSDVTGISNVAVEKAAEDGAYYTLSGVRVAQPAKGLYIHNGKKVIIK